MSAPQKFRSALNGFNREDVVSYLEYINSKHIAQVNQLTMETDFLRSQLEHAQPDAGQADVIAALEAERDDLRAQLMALQTRLDAMEQQAQPSAVALVAPSFSANEELEVYRRAERTERLARERSDMIYRQANSILSEATLRVNETAAQINPLAEQAMTQLSQLLNTISASKQTLQDAVVILNTLRPDNN